jgi:hypothetical protein
MLLVSARDRERRLGAERLNWGAALILASWIADRWVDHDTMHAPKAMSRVFR